MPPPRRALVVAVDGVLADTLSRRAEVLYDAMREVGLLAGTSASALVQSVAGRDWAGAARAAAGTEVDETLVDLSALAAERAWHRALALDAPVAHPDAIARCREAAAQGWRVLLRADSTRRAAGPLIDDLAAATDAARVIAGDDVRVTGGRALAGAQYAALQGALGQYGVVRVVEAGEVARAAAQELISGVESGWPAG
jgi:beta-phosphoglucomutase-like phosphatase (HAD superfamily)